jgi:hypothetical protein
LKHADLCTLEARFTIGRVLALAWRAWLGCRWPIILIGVPSAIAAACARWVTYHHIQSLSDGWQEMLLVWQDVLIECVAAVGITLAAVSALRGQSTIVRSILRIPWRRLPAVVVAGLIMQWAVYWPLALLDWTNNTPYGLVVDYAINGINALFFDCLAFVWLPILVMEQRSLAEALRCSIRLAMCHPWRIIAIDIGLWGIYFVFNYAVKRAYYLIDPRWSELAWSTMIAVWIVINMSVAWCIAAAAYHLLRTEQEGPAPEALARVFD